MHRGPLLVLMCGLPGSGKTTLARLLAPRLRALHWDKDALRALLFPPEAFRYDRELNDGCMELLYTAAAYALRRAGPDGAIVLDGRPYTLRSQRRRAVQAAAAAGARAVFVLCTAPLEILKQRAAGAHPAPDRGPDLVTRLAAEMEPFDEEDPIVIDTGSITPDEAVLRCLTALGTRASGEPR